MADGATASLRARGRRWLLLLAASATITAVFHRLSVPAALLLGPLVAGIVVAARGQAPSVPRSVATVGQAAVGCLIAGDIAGAFGPAVTKHWPLLLLLTVATVAASGALGYGLTRLGVVPGTVAIWGSMPGGASAMVVMAEAEGVDARLVSVMVYTRVLTVTAIATVLAALLGAGPAAAPAASQPVASPWTVAVVSAAGMAAARMVRWPAGTLLLAMAAGIVVERAGIAPVTVPLPLRVAALALVGWRIGLSFTGEALGVARRILPRLFVAALVLCAFCGLLAAVLHWWFGIDGMTAWLAASPGGLDAVAAIASSLPVDRPFVMAAQAVRFGVVMLIGPALATILARRSRAALMNR